jgi:hypothetical protein
LKWSFQFGMHAKGYESNRGICVFFEPEAVPSPGAAK